MTQDRRNAIKTIAAPLLMAGLGLDRAVAQGAHRTVVSIEGNAFHLNGRPTFPGRSYKGSKVEGLLFISRMVNAIIDDHNPETRGVWAYADGPWDPERNTREFIAALPLYRACGMNAVAFNVQGGSPIGYGWHQPWHTSGYAPDGALLPDYKARMKKAIEAADANGMVVNLGMFYTSSTPALANEAAFVRACDEVTDAVCEAGYTNVLIEIGNEVDIGSWRADIVKPPRAHELVDRVKQRSQGKIANPARRLLVSTSLATPAVPPERFMTTMDYILFHGNGARNPDGIRSLCRNLRAAAGYRGQPLLINEDDHFDFDQPDNDFLAAVQNYCGWGFFDYRQIRERFQDGYQSLPVDWTINSPRKRGFFNLLAEVTGSTPPPPAPAGGRGLRGAAPR
jgi:hypothetical protein